MDRRLVVRVITPERIVVDTPARSLRVPATDGSMGIFPRHAGMVAALEPGLLSIRLDGGMEEEMFVAGGFAEVRGDTVRVLTAAGEKVSEIDVERARAAERRARERLARRGGSDEIDHARALAALRRALARLQASARHGR